MIDYFRCVLKMYEGTEMFHNSLRGSVRQVWRTLLTEPGPLVL